MKNWLARQVVFAVALVILARGLAVRGNLVDLVAGAVLILVLMLP